MDAVTAIMEDHRVLERLFERLTRVRDNERENLVTELKIRFRVHNIAEETYVYPALVVHDRGECDEVHHGVREHRETEAKLAVLEFTDGEKFRTAVRDFTAAVRHHMAEEEGEILPALRAAVPPDLLRELGQDFETRRVGVLSHAGLDWSVSAR